MVYHLVERNKSLMDIYGENDRCESLPDEPSNESLCDARQSCSVAAECRDILQVCEPLRRYRRHLSAAYGKAVGTLKGMGPGVGAWFPDEE